MDHIPFDDHPKRDISMEVLHRLLAPFHFVMGKRIGPTEFVVLVSDHATLLYAACRVNASRRIAMAPNYLFPASGGMLTGGIHPESLNDVLSWTDRQTAMQRYADLIGDWVPSAGIHSFPRLALA